MKTKEELKEIRERNYDIWFKRFVKKEDLVKRIEISNEQGYTGYVLDVFPPVFMLNTPVPVVAT